MHFSLSTRSDSSKLKATMRTSLSRRALLRRGLWGGLLLSLGGLGWLGFRRGRKIEAPGGLKVLDEREYAALHATAERLVPPRPGAPTASEAGVALNADRALALAEQSVQQDVKRLLTLLENAITGFLFHAVTRPFSELSGEEQDRVLEGWHHSALLIKRSGFE